MLERERLHFQRGHVLPLEWADRLQFAELLQKVELLL